ncbi:hypothetical protein ACFLTD_02625 [Elusimicrobiota bacterium]
MKYKNIYLVICLFIALQFSAADIAYSRKKHRPNLRGFIQMSSPDVILVIRDKKTIVIDYGDYLDIEKKLLELGRNNSPGFPDEINIGKKFIPYYSAWDKETSHGKTMTLSQWQMKQAQRYGVSAKSIRKAVSKYRSAHGRNRDLLIEEFQNNFRKKYNVTMNEVRRAVDGYYTEESQILVDKIAQENGITDYRVGHWGPAASSWGIYGIQNGEKILWHNGNIYKGKERPRSYHTK